MGAITPVYGWPYQVGTDRPDGPNLGGQLALAIEATIAANDAARVAGDAALALLAPKYASRQILSGTVASVTFSSIPGTLRRLQISYMARADNAVQAQAVNLRFNADSTANYSYQVLQGSNATASAAAGVGTTSVQCGLCTGASAAAGIFGGGDVTVHGWDVPHPSSCPGVSFNSYALGVGAGNFVHSTGGGHWITPTGTPNSITFLPAAGNFVAGSDFQVTGW